MKKNIFNIFILVFLSIVLFGCSNEKYTINFIVNGGSIVDSITQEYNTNVTRPTDPTKEGYIFGGWYTDSELKEAYTFSTMPSQNITLYADWGSDNVEYEQKGNYVSIIKCIDDSNDVILLRKVSISGKTMAVTKIEENAFSGCSNLISITIPSSVKSIGKFAFSNCNSLTSITIPNSVTSIDEFAFSGCRRLVSITIPSSVKSIGVQAFEYCDDLIINCEVSSQPSGWYLDWNSNRPVYWGMNSSNFLEIDGFQYVLKDGNAIITRYIGKYSSVIIPSTVRINGKTVNVTQIGDYAFYGYGTRIIDKNSATSFTSITIPSSITSIGNYAFYGCYNLINITIPSSVTYIGVNAFEYCRYLVIYCEVSSEPSGWNNGWNKDKRAVYWGINSSNFLEINGIQYVLKDDYAIITRYTKYSNEVIIPSTVSIDGKTVEVTQIGNYAFTGCVSLNKIIIPSSVTSIGNYSFYHCIGLESITIPNNVTNIGDYAFYNCSSLESINIPYSVTNIGDYAFYFCSDLKSIIIPSSIMSIGNSAFEFCYKLTIYCEVSSKPSGWKYSWNKDYRPVYWGINISNFSEINGIHYVLKDDYAIITKYIGNYSDVIIPSTVNIDGKTVDVTQIENYAFYSCSNLSSIVIPSSITNIGDSVFQYCVKLTIYCEVSSQPSDWDRDWNNSNCPVVWGYVSK